jgi:serine/threonine-protein kinase
VERLIALDEKLPAILAKKEQPADNAERLALAYFCLEQKKLPVAALHFYQEAFAADAKLAEDLGNSYRYNAACAAALAGCGQGNDTGSLDDQERARLRKQARDWLQADLALWTRRADSDQPKERAAVQRTLEHWQSDMDLAGIRDQAALEKLLEAERNDYQKLWADVAAVWKRAGEPQ